MALNLSGVSQIATTAVSLGNLILVSPQKTVGYQPQNAPSWERNTAPQGKSLLFNYEGEQNVTLTSDITDHYIENNTAVQDQIALKPIMITTQGFVGELNDIPPGALAILKTAADKLTTISAYAPSLSTTALLAYANAFQLYQAASSISDSAISTWSSINGTGGETVINGSTTATNGAINGAQPNQTQQQIYFQQFYAYWQNRTLFTVQTPWAIFQDMAIQSVRALQSAETRVITDFEVVFKQLRFASTGLQANFDPNDAQSRLFSQSSGEVNNGTNQLVPSDTTFGSTLGGRGSAIQ